MPRKFSQIQRAIAFLILVAFFVTSIKSPAYAQYAHEGIIPLPAPGVMVSLSSDFTPAHLQGITIHPENALQFDFLIHEGDRDLSIAQKENEYTKLVRYFLASLTIPDDDQWVNLSPYEKNRIIKDDFGKTEMGRNLLAQDYLLKQITSSLIYPESGLGKKFWDTIYDRVWKEYHTTEIPVNTFNKVWIVPDQAFVYESGNTAYILKSHLKVMLEEDYLSLKKHTGITGVIARSSQGDEAISDRTTNNTHSIGSQLIREIILPQLEKEVNEGKNFANLRQMFSGMILATWYKNVLKESLLGKVYANRAKVQGVTGFKSTNPGVIASEAKQSQEKIYQRYLKAFKKGVFNYIKEDVDKYTNEPIPRKYFSGGFKSFERAQIATNVKDLVGNPSTPEVLRFSERMHNLRLLIGQGLLERFAAVKRRLDDMSLNLAVVRTGATASRAMMTESLVRAANEAYGKAPLITVEGTTYRMLFVQGESEQPKVVEESDTVRGFDKVEQAPVRSDHYLLIALSGNLDSETLNDGLREMLYQKLGVQNRAYIDAQIRASKLEFDRIKDRVSLIQHELTESQIKYVRRTRKIQQDTARDVEAIIEQMGISNSILKLKQWLGQNDHGGYAFGSEDEKKQKIEDLKTYIKAILTGFSAISNKVVANRQKAKSQRKMVFTIDGELMEDFNGYEFQIGEWGESLDAIKPLLIHLGQSPDAFNNITDAVDWLNSSTLPVERFIHDKGVDEALKELLEKKFVSKDFVAEYKVPSKRKALLAEFAVTFNGEKFKREYLMQLNWIQPGPFMRQDFTRKLPTNADLFYDFKDKISKMQQLLMAGPTFIEMDMQKHGAVSTETVELIISLIKGVPHTYDSYHNKMIKDILDPSKMNFSLSDIDKQESKGEPAIYRINLAQAEVVLAREKERAEKAMTVNVTKFKAMHWRNKVDVVLNAHKASVRVDYKESMSEDSLGYKVRKLGGDNERNDFYVTIHPNVDIHSLMSELLKQLGTTLPPEDMIIWEGIINNPWTDSKGLAAPLVKTELRYTDYLSRRSEILVKASRGGFSGFNPGTKTVVKAERIVSDLFKRLNPTYQEGQKKVWFIDFGENDVPDLNNLSVLEAITSFEINAPTQIKQRHPLAVPVISRNRRRIKLHPAMKVAAVVVGLAALAYARHFVRETIRDLRAPIEPTGVIKSVTGKSTIMNFRVTEKNQVVIVVTEGLNQARVEKVSASNITNSVDKLSGFDPKSRGATYNLIFDLNAQGLASDLYNRLVAKGLKVENHFIPTDAAPYNVYVNEKEDGKIGIWVHENDPLGATWVRIDHQYELRKVNNGKKNDNGVILWQLKNLDNRNPNKNVDEAALAVNGGIDFNGANLNIQIKRDGRGVPLPLARQDMAQLSHIQGFVPEVIEIKSAVNLPFLNELEQKLQGLSA